MKARLDRARTLGDARLDPSSQFTRSVWPKQFTQPQCDCCGNTELRLRRTLEIAARRVRHMLGIEIRALARSERTVPLSALHPADADAVRIDAALVRREFGILMGYER